MIEIVRISKIEINNLKNVNHGVINLYVDKLQENEPQSNILSIYGPNGSGKTTVLNAIEITNELIRSHRIEKNYLSMISLSAKSLAISIEFRALINNKDYLLYYSYEINSETILKEKLAYKNLSDSKRKQNLKSFKNTGKKVLRSVVFSKEAMKNYSDSEKVFLISLKQYAYNKVYIITSSNKYRTFLIHGNSSDNDFSNDTVQLDINNCLVDENYEKIMTLVNNINDILPHIINDMHLIVKTKNQRLIFYTTRFGQEIKLQNESEGIKKLVFFINHYIEAFNDPSITLVCDELDSCIFEFLFGELLSIFSRYALGQLIFTSHNLRPLEVLDNKQVIFTTMNKDNKFIHFLSHSKDLRTQYYESILLGGHQEAIYKKTDLIALSNKLIQKR